MWKFRFPRFPIAVEFTREGLLFVLLSLAIGAAAANTGNNVLYLIFSVMMALIVVSGMISRRVLMGLSPAIDFPEHLFSGISNVCYISVENRKKRLPSVAIRFAARDPGFPDINRHFFYIPSRDRVSGFAPVLFNRRGVFRLTEMELQTIFPFAFFIKIRRYQANHTVRVFPRIYRLSEQMISKFAEGIIQDSPYRGDGHQLLHLRDYTQFDSSKRIHWKASAKLEKLLIKEFQRDQGRDLFLYFDCYPVEDSEDIHIPWEKSICLVASLAYFFLEHGIAAKMMFPGFQFETGQSSSLLPLLNHLSEMKPGHAPFQPLELPSDPDAITLVIQSKKIPPRMNLMSHSAKVLLIEDWSELLRDSVRM